MDYKECPRYDKHELDDEQIEAIAQRAAEKAVELAKDDLFKEVGHSVLKGLYYVIGVAAVALFIWLARIGIIKQ